MRTKANDLQGAVGMRKVPVAEFRRAITRLPADKPAAYPGKTYRTQKQHWINWLTYYNTEGAYDRQPGKNRDARYAYNHIVEPKMLLWLIPAAGVTRSLVRAASEAGRKPGTMMAQSAAIRRVVPWAVVEAALWPAKAKNRTDGTGETIR